MLPAIVLPEPDSSNGLLDAALHYAGRGWSVIPVAGKKAAVPFWLPFRERPPDAQALREMFAKPGITGLAVITGAVSQRLAARDFDQTDAYEQWARANPSDAARLPTVRTARGFHVYGRLETEVFKKLGDGELRAASTHYVVLPPSLHPDGPVYKWIVPLPDGELPLLTDTLSNGCAKNHVTHVMGGLGCAESPLGDARGDVIQTIIRSTLPSGAGQRNGCLWTLARKLKAIRRNATAAELRLIVQEWHRQALPYIRTKDFSESWSDFVRGWDQVRCPAGHSLAAAVAAAKSNPLPAIVAQNGYDGKLALLTAICWELAKKWRKRPFPLSCKVAAEHLEISTQHAGRLLETLQFDDVLKRAKKHNRRKGKAREWRFIAMPGQEEPC
jgi:hypothetical protein